MALTTKQYNGYKKAASQPALEGITFNEDYNKKEFGITRAIWNAIHSLVVEERGMSGAFPSLKSLQKRIEDRTAAGERYILTLNKK